MNLEKICMNCQFWLINKKDSEPDSSYGSACYKIGPDLPQSPIPTGSAVLSDYNFSSSLVTRGTFGCSLFQPKV